MVRKKRRGDFLLWIALTVIGAIAGSFTTAAVFSTNAHIAESEFNGRIKQLSDQLKESQQSSVLLKRQLAAKAKAEGGTSNAQITELTQQLEQALAENSKLNQQLLDLQDQQEEPASESLTEQLAKNIEGVAKAVNLIDSRPTIQRAAAINGINFYTANPYSLLLVGVTVKNETSKAINSLQFHVQLRAAKRQVPHSETVVRQSIPGGIEPGETKLLQLDIPTDELNLGRLDFKLRLPPGTQVYVAIVQDEDYQPNKPYYEMFANLPHVLAPYTFVERRDPFMQSIIGP